MQAGYATNKTSTRSARIGLRDPKRFGLRDAVSTRVSSHAERERVVFDAFLRAHSTLGENVADIQQPDNDPPDIIAVMKDGTRVNFELVEWLHGEQMAEARRHEDLATAIMGAIGPQNAPRSPHVQSAMLSPRPAAPRFARVDSAAFGIAIWELMRETDERWLEQPLWHSPQGRICGDFSARPILAKYLASVHFHPRHRRARPDGVDWIVMEQWGGAFDPAVARNALVDAIRRKVDHYGPFSEPIRLLVYYGQATLYNTPYRGADLREFHEVAEFAAQAVRSQNRFERIYLLNALEPGLQALEIFPDLAECQ